jgi:P2 family phage contractile tail tube protein
MKKIYANKVVDLYSTIKDSSGKYIEIGDVTSFTVTEVTFADGEVAGAGILGTVNIPDIFSIEAMEAAVTTKSYSEGAIEAFNPSGVSIRHNWAVDNINGSGDGGYTSYTATIKGRPKNIPGGDTKKGEAMELTTNIACSYYKLVKNGKVIHEIDPLNGKIIINGTDYAKALNTALNK